MKNDETNFDEVIKTLRGLKQVEAPAYFEADLMRKINSDRFAANKKSFFFFNMLASPIKFLPAAALSFAAVLIVLVLAYSPEKKETTPFSAQPKIIKESDLNSGNSIGRASANQADQSTNNSDSISNNSDEENTNLVYKPIFLTPSEKAKVKELKDKVFQDFDAQSNGAANP